MEVNLTDEQRRKDKANQMRRDIERLPDKTALYFALVKGYIGLYDGSAEDSGIDNSDRHTIFSEIENAIDLLRRNWDEI